MRLASWTTCCRRSSRADRVGLVQTYDLSAIYGSIEAVEGEPGHPAIDPALLLAVWLTATLDGVGSARALDRLCREHLAYQWLLGGVRVNYHTLADFRVQHETALDALLTRSVAALMDEGLVDLHQTAQGWCAGAASARRQLLSAAETLEAVPGASRAACATTQKRRGSGRRRARPTPRQAAARQRAARERLERVEHALQEVAKVQAPKTSSANSSARNARRAPPAPTRKRA